MPVQRLKDDLGRLRHRVTLQRISQSPQNAYGDPVPQWSDLGTRYADVQQQGGREFWYAAQQNANLTHLVRIYYFSGLTTQDRVLWDGRTLNIDSITNPDGQKVFMDVHCIEQFTAAQPRTL